MAYQKLNPNQRFVHSPTTTTLDDVEVAISPQGHVTLKKDDGDGEYDQLELKAGTLFKITRLLRDTRKIVEV